VSPTTVTERPRLKQRYDSQIRAELQQTLGLANIMEVPRLTKIVINSRSPSSKGPCVTSRSSPARSRW
jgi:hypothetical protein